MVAHYYSQNVRKQCDLRYNFRIQNPTCLVQEKYLFDKPLDHLIMIL